MKTPESITSYESVDDILDIETISDELERERIQMKDFEDHQFFDDSDIEADMAHCHELHLKFEEKKRLFSAEQKEQYARGKAAEYTFRHALEKYGWLSEKTKLIVTSQFDDYVRGIDSVAQIELGPDRFEHLGFAIDFTTSADEVGFKIKRTFDSIDQGFTPAVKYFNSGKTGILKNFKVPRIVIGTDPENLRRLAGYSAEIIGKTSIAKESEESIRQDSFRYTLYGEIIGQLSVFINRLKKVISQAEAKNRSDISKRARNSLSIHEKALNVIQELIKELNIDTKMIGTNIKGGSFANKMAVALSALSQTPIEFKE